LKKLRKIILLILTVWPLIFIYVYYDDFLEVIRIAGFDDSVFALVAVNTLLTFVDLAIYITDLNRNKEVSDNDRFVWLLGFIILNLVAMFVYWWKYIWPRRDVEG
jgi:hypothetical protein